MMENYRNRVEARGKVIGIGRDTFGHFRLILFVRATRDRQGTYISFAIDPSATQDIRVNDTISLVGHVVAYEYTNDVNGKKSYSQYFVADSISLEKPVLQEVYGQEGFAYDESFTKIYLKGEVTNIRKSPDDRWTTVTIHPEEQKGERPVYVHVQYSSAMRVQEKQFEVGDEICMYGFLISRKKERDGRVDFFENVIVNDLSRVSRAETEAFMSGMDGME